MNFQELDSYIRDLQQSGFNTVKLRVQFYRKFSVPLFALIMAMISIPFGFLVGGVVDVIDPGTFTVLNTIPVGDLPHVVKMSRSEEHTSELQSLRHLVCRLLL